MDNIKCETFFKSPSRGAQRGLIHLERTEGLNGPNYTSNAGLIGNPFLKFQLLCYFRENPGLFPGNTLLIHLSRTRKIFVPYVSIHH